MKSKARKYCRNCFYPISPYAKYCSQCNQKNTDGRVPVIDFVQDFFSNIFNVDSKLFLTIFALFIPGKLTVEYFKGRHKSYASPVRLFLFAGITLFAVIISKTQDVDFGGNQAENVQKAERTRINKIFQEKLNLYKDTYLQDTSLYFQADSLRKWVYNDIGGYDSDSVGLGNLLGRAKEVRISNQDLANLPVDSILVKYKLRSGFESVIVGQQLKFMKDGRSGFHYFLGKIPIMMFLMMPFLALALLVLYARHTYYFVEHLVFSFHYHTFGFAVVLFLVFFGKLLNGWMIAGFIISIFVYQFMAMRRYYQQGFFKTALKFILLNFVYIMLIFFFFIAAATISFLLF